MWIVEFGNVVDVRVNRRAPSRDVPVTVTDSVLSVFSVDDDDYW